MLDKLLCMCYYNTRRRRESQSTPTTGGKAKAQPAKFLQVSKALTRP